ncbi:MAG: hypothetical protein KZQ76_06470 [Candidatus Thiodiazotropha sp. (ex Epidulcina cf. delphinae)]|nr:hypothetical protein [Candidatus Thiodiazotropha sp. (ex Epidulcina cf. delphinae)]
MPEDHSKPKALSDRALELIMRDVLNGLRDFSLHLQGNSMQPATASASPQERERPAHAELSSDDHITTPGLKKSG